MRYVTPNFTCDIRRVHRSEESRSSIVTATVTATPTHDHDRTRTERTNEPAEQRPRTQRRSAAAGAARVRGLPSGLKGATASPQRPPCGRPLTPETRYGPADAYTTRADAHGAHPGHTADRRPHSNERPKGWLQTVSLHYDRRVWLRKAIRNQEAARPKPVCRRIWVSCTRQPPSRRTSSCLHLLGQRSPHTRADHQLSDMAKCRSSVPSPGYLVSRV
ncbi:hypothetical protein C8E87_6000 [Paractinoplanes brasiliensis]|uniref:Uncharacterized protein n=1 Tax=Paractinoplanes brasiliensis TaxID=52695 RepID=A0A4R6JZC9_9ACTN|nr:hypothetical protein C8E87_6000 [Actinoplanes brasiliensis]